MAALPLSRKRRAAKSCLMKNYRLNLCRGRLASTIKPFYGLVIKMAECVQLCRKSMQYYMYALLHAYNKKEVDAYGR